MARKHRKNNHEAAALWQTPWAMRQVDLSAAIQHQFAKLDEADRDLFEFDESDDMPEITIDDGIAHFCIEGVIGNRMPVWMQKFFGFASVDSIGNALDVIERDSSVTGLIIEIDSPGGTVSGVPELADRIASMSIPVVAYTPNLMASAAYWIASACDYIVATPSAIVGSVGVYMPAVTFAKYYESMGINVELIKAGKYKGALYPGTELSDEQREDLQSGVDYVYGLFTGAVSRRQVDAEFLQGQDFYAAQATESGMIDEVCDLDAAYEALAAIQKTGQPTNE